MIHTFKKSTSQSVDSFGAGKGDACCYKVTWENTSLTITGTKAYKALSGQAIE